MLLKVSNLGMIKEAEVNLNGLTVIAGENDTGKSTMGRLLFAIVKAFSRYDKVIREHLIQEVMRQFPNLTKEQIEQIFFQEQANKLLEATKLSLEHMLVAALLHDLKKGEYINEALNKALVSEFYYEISNKLNKGTTSISCMKDEKDIFNLKLDNNKIQDLHRHDILPFDDVTFIETPIILQMYDVISHARSLFEINTMSKADRLWDLGNPTVSFHMKDLLSKLEIAPYIIEEEVDNTLIQDIFNIIGGRVTFEKDARDFVFYKKVKSQDGDKEISVKSMNIATGIKAFGAIQLLIQSGFLDEKSLLIIDEPEVHLHPKWQVEYAKIIVALAKNGITVLVTSHSPYIIEALKYFSAKEDIKQKTNFYLAESQEEGYSYITDVTKDLNKIFKKLSDPLQDLVWEDLC